MHCKGKMYAHARIFCTQMSTMGVTLLKFANTKEAPDRPFPASASFPAAADAVLTVDGASFVV